MLGLGDGAGGEEGGSVGGGGGGGGNCSSGMDGSKKIKIVYMHRHQHLRNTIPTTVPSNYPRGRLNVGNLGVVERE